MQLKLGRVIVWKFEGNAYLKQKWTEICNPSRGSPTLNPVFVLYFTMFSGNNMLISPFSAI